MKRKIVIGITGASGAIYAKLLLDFLEKKQEEFEKIELIFSGNATDVWEYELGNKDYNTYPFNRNEPTNFFTGPASGSAGFDTMIICPASMGTIGRIASGVSNDLMTRAADVMLKERKRLILVPRESPYNLIHLRNMTTIAEAGAIIIPATPSFYSHPQSIEDVALTVVHRILKLADLHHEGFRWGEN
ncbi:MAG: UbiX family flavin prenyltransferase [Bacteroidales bacterium]|nr:UbiX family flavin prenyltransferase [Bacteroidales bacterium]